MFPEHLARVGIEAEHGVGVVGIPGGVDVIADDGEGGESGADAGLPQDRRAARRPAIEPALFLRDAVVTGPAPHRPMPRASQMSCGSCATYLRTSLTTRFTRAERVCGEVSRTSRPCSRLTPVNL